MSGYDPSPQKYGFVARRHRGRGSTKPRQIKRGLVPLAILLPLALAVGSWALYEPPSGGGAANQGLLSNGQKVGLPGSADRAQGGGGSSDPGQVTEPGQKTSKDPGARRPPVPGPSTPEEGSTSPARPDPASTDPAKPEPRPEPSDPAPDPSEPVPQPTETGGSTAPPTMEPTDPPDPPKPPEPTPTPTECTLDPLPLPCLELNESSAQGDGTLALGNGDAAPQLRSKLKEQPAVILRSEAAQPLLGEQLLDFLLRLRLTS